MNVVVATVIKFTDFFLSFGLTSLTQEYADAKFRRYWTLSSEKKKPCTVTIMADAEIFHIRACVMYSVGLQQLDCRDCT